MTANTTTTATTSEHDTSPSYEQYQQQEEERAALDAWRATGARLAAAMKAVGTAQQTLDAAREEEIQTRLDQPNKHKAYLAIKDARRQALRVRRESFKTRVRAAGLQTKFISLSDKDMDVLEQMESDGPGGGPGGGPNGSAKHKPALPAFVSLERLRARKSRRRRRKRRIFDEKDIPTTVVITVSLSLSLLLL
jgi:hypothetical protein